MGGEGAGASMAVTIPSKGGGDQFMMDRVMEWLEENGDNNVHKSIQNICK